MDLHAMLAHYRGSGPRLCLFIPCADYDYYEASSVNHHQMEMEEGGILTVQMDLTLLRPFFCRSDLVSLHVRLLEVLLSVFRSVFLFLFFLNQDI